MEVCSRRVRIERANDQYAVRRIRLLHPQAAAYIAGEKKRRAVKTVQPITTVVRLWNAITCFITKLTTILFTK